MNIEKIYLTYSRIIKLIIFLLVLFIISFSLPYISSLSSSNEINQNEINQNNDKYNVEVIQEVKCYVNEQEENVSLPLSLKNLPHGSEVKVSFKLNDKNGQSLFFGSVYAPLSIYINGQILYEYGQKENFPKFFKDPPTEYNSIILPIDPPNNNNNDNINDNNNYYNINDNNNYYNINNEILVEMIYHSPVERNTFLIHPFLVGSQMNILHYLISKYGISWVLSIFFIFVGIFLLTISLFFLKAENKGRAFMSPGMLALCSGLWQFGENTLSVYILQTPTILYIIDFLGLFTLVIPLYKLGMLFMNVKNSIILKIFVILQEVSVVAALFLQLFGIVSLHRSLYFFHILLPLCILVLTMYTLFQAIYYKNKTATLFFSPFLILFVATLLELLNYKLYFLPQFSQIFQLGLFIFTVLMTTFSGIYAKNLYFIKLKNIKLANELSIQEQIIKAQTERNELLLSHFDDIKKQRHDIRHHLRSIRDLIEKQDYDSTLEYINSLTNTIPTYTPETYCENNIVNSTISYYVHLAKQQEIKIDVLVQVPTGNKYTSDSNLCIIFGNLLENAIEACKKGKPGNSIIRLTSKVAGEMLFITMDNSLYGNIQMQGEEFCSSKHSGIGTGLRSIRSIAESHNGSAKFTASQNIFRSEVCLRL